MPKGSEEKRGRGLFEAGTRHGKRETVRERRIRKAHKKKPFDIRVREQMAIDSPIGKLRAPETKRRIKRLLSGSSRKKKTGSSRKKKK